MSNPNPSWPPPHQPHQPPQFGGPFSQFPGGGTGGGFYPPPPKPESGMPWWLIGLGVIGGGGILLAVLCCGGVLYFAQPPKASAAAKQPFVYSDVPVPAFPDGRGEGNELIEEPGVQQYVIELGPDSGGFYPTPGHGGSLYLNLPEGTHAPGSLPCVLIAGAGSTLLAGMEIGEGDFPEHFPYVKAGYAVVAYELDGPDYSGDGDTEAMAEAFETFEESRAGLVNARNALEYVLAKVPEVNPKQIYAAGHSSAATHALLFAEHEPRLAGVMAYAPATDLPKWFKPRLRLLTFILPGVTDFITQSSPSTHIQRLKCPTLLFHAEDDSTTEIAETKAFAEQLKAQGAEVTLVTVPTGGHYDSMINEGIPAGIRWLGERTKK